jgi:nitrogen regulatory protein PII
MYLLVIITRQEDKTYDFLKLLPTVGVRGATVIEGRGMGRILRDRETVFTSIEQILSASIDLTDNVVILSLVQGGEVLASVRRLARQVFGDFSRPNTGVLFVLPVADAEGLATGPDLTLPGSAHQDATI